MGSILLGLLCTLFRACLFVACRQSHDAVDDGGQNNERDCRNAQQHEPLGALGLSYQRVHGGKGSVRVLCGVLAATLVLGAFPGRASASAASAPGEIVATFELGENYGGLADKIKVAGWWFRCKGAGYWEYQTEGALNIRLKGGCVRGYSMTDHRFDVYAASPGCGNWSAYFGNVDDSDTRPFDVTMVPPAGTSDYSGCGPVVQLCFVERDAAPEGEGPFLNGDGEQACVPFPLGVPPVDEPGPALGDCPLGSPWGPFEMAWRWDQKGNAAPPLSTTAPTRRAWLTKVGNVGVTPAGPTSVPAGDWYAYVVLRGAKADRSNDGGGNMVNGVLNSTVQGQVTIWRKKYTWTAGQGIPPSMGSADFSVAYGNSTSGVADLDSPEVLGFGLYRTTSTVNVNITDQQGPTGPFASPYAGVASLGYTAPTHCSWYWGAKLVTDSNTDADEPLDTTPPEVPGPPNVHVGPASECPEDADVCVDPEDGAPSSPLPDPDSEECDLSPWDPSTYGTQVECAIARMVQVVVVTMIELIEAVTGLGDLLKWLFVPPDGMWADAWARVASSWEDSALDDWSDALGSLFPDTSQTSCRGPTIGPIEFYSGVEIPEMHPLDACEEPQASAAAMVKGVLTVGITLGGAWRMWDMLAGSFGAYRGGGRHMSDSDWL